MTIENEEIDDTTSEGAETDAGTETEQPEQNIDELASQAFDEALSGKEEDVPKDAADVSGDTREADPVEGAPAREGEQAKPEAPADPAADAKAKVDAEVADLKLKGRSAERFHEMAGELNKSRDVRDFLTENKIDSKQALEEIVGTAQRAREWESTVLSSTASPEQFSAALQTIQAMNGDDPQAKGAVFDSLLESLKILGAEIGRDIAPSNPLEGHDDLLAAVESGELSTAYAAQIAQQRGISQAQASRRQQATQQTQAQRQQSEQRQQQEQDAYAQVNELSETLKATDPQFAAKLQAITPQLQQVTQQLPPSQWAGAVQRLYRGVKIAPAVAARVPVSTGPMRGQTGSPRMQPRTNDPLEAFDQGLDSLTG